MGRYFDSATLRAAASRLADSRCHTRMLDYLILRRAMVRSDTDSVTLSKNDDDFIGAINDYMRTAPVENDVAPGLPPLVNVFGSSRSGDHGHRTEKYYSNGTGSTVHRWPMLDVVDERPMVVKFSAEFENELAVSNAEDSPPYSPALLVAGGAKALLADSATWFFRFHDLDQIDTSEETFWSDLSADYRSRAGLTDNDVRSLFSDSSPPPLTTPDVIDEEQG